jgi:lipopolysaccharide export system ATP-binding protein
MTLRAINLGKQYKGRRVLDGVSIEVSPGEVVGLLGPNGAGKTTTFHSIVGFVNPDQGRIEMEGQEITKMPMHSRARAGIGYLPQETSIFRKLTVEENIYSVLEIRDMTRSERQQCLDELIAELNLEGRAHQQADTLSGGETRRVEIARALACEPQYILLDEPFAGIDPRTVEDLQNIVSDLRKRGLGVLVTDHSVRETLAITDRAYIIIDGKILTFGSAEALINDEKVRQLYLGARFQMNS